MSCQRRLRRCAAAAVPTAEAVAAERERIERLVLHGRQREWLAYLHEVVELIERPADGDDAAARARARATT